MLHFILLATRSRREQASLRFPFSEFFLISKNSNRAIRSLRSMGLHHPNGHGKGAAPENETRYARFPLPNPLLNPPRPLLNPPPVGEEAIALSPSGGKLERGFGEEAIVPSPSGGRLG